MSSLPTPTFDRTVRGSGPGLLLAHGAGGGIEPNYGPLMDGLAEHFTVVGPDYPGTGRTPRSDAPLTLDGVADELVAAAVAEGLETFAVTGYSLGAAVAVRAATRHPERVTALVLTAGFARPNPRFTLATELWRQLLQADDPAGLTAFGALLGFTAPAADALSQDDVDAMLAAGWDAVPPGALEHVDLASRVDVLDDLPRLSVPTLVISTTEDSLVTPFHHHQLAEGIPGARLAELATGHLPFVERPKEWLDLMVGFLAASA
ncbi:alpha/beta fold hydrolase [Streptomyces huiliensis]|uniref:alpha/beta fold hydrolase n=1 Tax=Streptomyces huiliensis TaxID=2876027 RepID=UPI001CC003AF|nr:alpha/beta fold hydrolase [Streptomyces huiliensis]MBZ4321514.1 alpha/beta hydrolase [Streptomyces huiliensis]